MSTGNFAVGLIGVVLDERYRLDAVLGEGGMGSVFRAQHLAMDRRVAVKLLKPHLTQDAIATQRFLREARATMKVESPHVVKIFDFGVTPHGDYYMALEYLDGRSVQRELEVDGPFAPSRVLHIARNALHALGNAHKQGIVHRDIKPDNILLIKVGADADYAKLLDFGVAKLMEGTASDSGTHAMALTQAGMVFGTPEFMSPEQACGQPLDGRSDLYSLAATMFAMLTGCALFEGKTPIELLTHHVRTPPPHLEQLQPELAQYPELDALLQRCLAKRPDQRPADAAELDAALAQLESYVEAGGAAARPKVGIKSAGLSASAYFLPLPPETLVPPLRPSPATPPEVDPLPEESVADELRASTSRAPLLALGGLGIAAVLIAIVFATRGGTTDEKVPRVAVPREPNPTVVVDAAVVIADAGGVAILPRDASIEAVPPTNLPVQGSIKAPKDNAHLRAAEQAQRENNSLRQLAEADLALQDDPRSARARYLLADALLKSGDLDRGCEHLRALGRYPLAIARANAAQCPK